MDILPTCIGYVGKLGKKKPSFFVAGFSCPITLGQQEACDWSGKREAELRVADTEASQEIKEEAKMDADGQEEEPELVCL